jgi:uncharacterized protein (TIGR03083 family)
MSSSPSALPSSLGPILVAPLLLIVDRLLIDLLGSLSPEEWERQTVAAKWKVKDVAAHLLDTQLRKLSIVRDSAAGEPANIRSPQDLVAFINRLNEEGVRVYRRLSPEVLISLLEVSARESAAFHQSLDPFAPAMFAVSWAGDEVSPNWFDTARELTERWHHQQQIRLAVHKPDIMTPELYHPVLDCFMRGLPHAFRDVHAENGTEVRVDVTGDCGGTWWLHRRDGRWLLLDAGSTAPSAHVVIPQEIAWLVFTKGVGRDDAPRQAQIYGDETLGSHVLRLIAIVG